METLLAIEREIVRNKLLIACFVCLNVIDAIVTLVGYKLGGYELNFIARYTLENHIIWAFWLHKIAVALALVFAISFLATEYPRQIKRVWPALVFVVGGVCVFNLTGVLL